MRSRMRAAALAVALLACAPRPPVPDAGAEVVVEAAGGALAVAVELAATPAAWQRGMMGRRTLAAHQGMLFVFPAAAARSFWMQDTPLPLDLIFIGEDLRVAELALDARPNDPTSLGGRVPARLVLEVVAGLGRRHRVQVGDRVRLRRVPGWPG